MGSHAFNSMLKGCLSYQGCPCLAIAAKPQLTLEPLLLTYGSPPTLLCLHLPASPLDCYLQSHNVFEAWLHPDKYRTQICIQGTSCKRKVRPTPHATCHPTCLPLPPPSGGCPSLHVVPLHSLWFPSKREQDAI